MASEPINIPIKTTYDDEGAKDALKDAEKLDKLDPTVDVDADTSKAEGALGDVEDAAKKVDKLDPEVQVSADTSNADSGLDDVKASAQALMDRNPWVAEFMADTSAAKSELESLQGKLSDTGDKADDTKRHIDKIGSSEGPRLAGNQVADLTGPFGDASGAASNFGGVFDGLADIGEKVAGKIGLDAAAMASAISGIGFAVAAAAAVWSIFKQKQEEAKKKAAEHLKLQEDLNDAIKNGNREVAASKFVDLYGDIIKKGHEAGLSTNEIVDAIQGAGDAADTAKAKIGALDTKIADLSDQLEALRRPTDVAPTAAQQEIAEQIRLLEGQRDALKGAGEEFANLTDKQKANEALQSDVQTAIFGTSSKLDDAAAAADKAKRKTDDLTAAMDTLKGNLDVTRQSEDMAADFDNAFFTIHSGMQPTLDDLRGLEDDIIRAGETAKANPIDIDMALNKIKEGDLAGAHADAQSWLNQHALTVKIQTNAQQVQDVISKITNPFRPSGTAAGTSSVTTVNVHLPRGARHSDIARAMNMATRRNGRRFGMPQVHYARR